MTEIEIKGDKENPICAKVLINGQEIQGVTGVVYEHRAGNLPEVTIALDGMRMDLYAVRREITEICKVTIVEG